MDDICGFCGHSESEHFYRVDPSSFFKPCQSQFCKCKGYERNIL